jgi:hypothetical protein
LTTAALERLGALACPETGDVPLTRAEFAKILAAARERDALRAELYELKLAAAGGEDVPGSAEAVTPADVGRWRREQSEILAAVTAERDRFKDALQAIVDGDVPRPLGARYREDEKPSKNDACKHGRAMWEDCGQCVDEFAAAALTPATPSEDKR